MKKVLSLVLALAMACSCTSVAFAAPTDVTNEDQAKAVDALVALDIVNGYEDGSYKPENVVTRAEMAKMLVGALGYADLATDSQASFTDAKGTWYEGVVSVAAGLNIVNGYPDGTFKGNNPVSYQEACNMIVRALGYTDQTVNNGVNAYNATAYKTQAAKSGILDNVSFKAGGANRGDVAVMVYNALEVETVETNSDGKAEKIVSYEESETLDNGKIKITPVYEILLDRVADRDEFVVTPNMVDKDHKDYKGDLVDLEPYMYQDIKVYQNDDDDVVFVKSVESDTTEGTLDVPSDNKTNVLYVKDDNDKTTEVKLDKTTGTAIKVFYNGKEIEMDESQIEYKPATETASKTVTVDGKQIVPLKDAKVTIVQNKDDEVLGIVATKATYGTKVDRTYRKDATKLDSICLPVDDDNDVDLTKVTVTGAVEDINDVKEDDVVIVYAAQGYENKAAQVADSVKLVVVRDTVEGKITKTNTAKDKFTIDGTEYKLSDVLGCIDDLKVGKEGTFYLDNQGKVFDFDGETVSKPVDYAIVVSVYDGEKATDGRVKFDPELKLYTKAGEKVTYVVDEDAEYKDDDNNKISDVVDSDYTFVADKIAVNSLVKYKLNDKNEIVSLTVVEKNVTTATAPKIATDSKAFGLTKDAVVFNVKANGTGFDYDLADNDSLPDDIDTVYYSDTNDDGDYTIIVAADATEVDGTYALITKVENILNDDDEDVLFVTAYVDGEKKEYTTTTKLTTKENIGSSNINKGVVVEITLDGGDLDEVKAVASTRTVNVTTGSSIYVNVAKNGYGLSFEDEAGNDVIVTFEGGSTAVKEFDDDAVVYTVNSDKEFVAASVGEGKDADGAQLIAAYDFDDDGKIDCIIVK